MQDLASPRTPDFRREHPTKLAWEIYHPLFNLFSIIGRWQLLGKNNGLEYSN
jgi:hypothetical protein